MDHRSTSIWTGINESFPSKNSDTSVFAHPVWVEKSTARLERALQGPSPDEEICTVSLHCLSGAVAAVASTKGDVTITDVGGNLGQAIIAMAQRFPKTRITGTVFEQATLLDACSRLLTLPTNITFKFIRDTETKLATGATDVVHFGSSLQYIRNWRASLAAAASTDASWIVLSDVPVGSTIPTFASMQKYYESFIPCWFFNLDDLEEYLAKLGYLMIYSSPYVNPRTSSYFPEESFPESHRIPFPSDMMFTKT